MTGTNFPVTFRKQKQGMFRTLRRNALCRTEKWKNDHRLDKIVFNSLILPTIMEWLRLEGISAENLVQSLTQQGDLELRLCPVSFWFSPRIDFPKPSWSTLLGHPHSQKLFSGAQKEPPEFQFVPIASRPTTRKANYLVNSQGNFLAFGCSLLKWPRSTCAIFPPLFKSNSIFHNSKRELTL